MDFNEQHIRKYIKGELSNEEEELFEREMITDPRLRERVYQERATEDFMELLIEEDLREQMESWESKRQQKSTFNTFLKLAAALTIIIMTYVAAYFYSYANYSPASLAKTYQEMDLLIINPRNLERSKEEQIKEIELFYLREEYTEALSAIKRYETGEFDERLELIRAMSYYHLGFRKRAEELLKKIIDYEDSQEWYTDQAEWHLLMLWLNGDAMTASFFQLLNKLAEDPNHLYNRSAVELNDDLDSFWYKKFIQ